MVACCGERVVPLNQLSSVEVETPDMAAVAEIEFRACYHSRHFVQLAQHRAERDLFDMDQQYKWFRHRLISLTSIRLQVSDVRFGAAGSDGLNCRSGLSSALG